MPDPVPVSPTTIPPAAQTSAAIDFSSIGGKRVIVDAPGGSSSAASGAGQPIDFSAIGGKKVGSAGEPANPYPISPGDKGFVAQTAKTGEGILKLPGHIWDAFANGPQDEDEKKAEALGGRGNLALYRLISKPMEHEAKIADAYETIHKSLSPEEQEREKDFGNMNSNLHKANMHRIASIAPMLGPMAADISEHYLQGDKSGAVTSLLENIGLGKAMDSATKGLGKQISKVAPKKVVVAGETTPVMAGQVKDAAPIAKEVAAEPSPAIAEQQQTAAQQGVKNVATDALNNQLKKVGRDATPAQDQLPAGPDEPFKFTIKGDLPKEVVQGKGVVPAAKQLVPDAAGGVEPNYAYRVRDVGEEGVPVRNGHAQATMSEPEAHSYVEGRQNMRGGAPQEVVKVDLNKLDPADYSIKEGPSGNSWVRFNKDLPESAVGESPRGKWQYTTSSTEAGETVSTQGPGTLHTTDAEAAAQTLAALRGLKNQTPAVKEAAASLEDQLQKYHAYDGKTPPSSPAVPKSGQASSFGDAAAQTKAAAQPTFKKLDKLSDGEFSAFQNKLKMATAAERRATTMEDMEAAQQAQKEARDGIDNLMQKHSSQFQPNELANAQSAWRDMNVLDDIHGYVEKAFSAPESIASKSNLVSRTLDGKKLISNLNQMVDKIPAEDLQRVLGDDGLHNLYELGQLTSKAENAANMGTIVDQVSSRLFKSGVGATVGHAMGGTAGAAAGAGLDVFKDMVIRQISTKPRVADLTIKALKAGTPAKIYGPLIANEIAKGQQQDGK